MTNPRLIWKWQPILNIIKTWYNFSFLFSRKANYSHFPNWKLRKVTFCLVMVWNLPCSSLSTALKSLEDCHIFTKGNFLVMYDTSAYFGPNSKMKLSNTVKARMLTVDDSSHSWNWSSPLDLDFGYASFAASKSAWLLHYTFGSFGEH